MTEGPADLDRNGYSRTAATHQKVLNTSWPSSARGIPDMGRIPATARLVFERDGETWLEGDAVRWTGRHVCVAIGDPRLQVAYVWLDADDVRRR